MKVTTEMLDDAITGARAKLKYLKRTHRNTPIFESEIKQVRKRLSHYGLMKERLGK